MEVNIYGTQERPRNGLVTLPTFEPQVVDGRFVWHKKRKYGELQEAMIGILSDGPVWREEVMRKLQVEFGYSYTGIYKARQSLGIVTTFRPRNGRRANYWSLPEYKETRPEPEKPAEVREEKKEEPTDPTGPTPWPWFRRFVSNY